MKVTKFTKYLMGGIITLFLMPNLTKAQTQTPLDIALRHVEKNYQTWQVTKADVSNMYLSDQVFTKHNGVNHIYLMQSHAGIEVYNAILTVNILPNGEVFHVASSSLIPNISELVNTTSPNLSAYQAIEAAANHLNLTIDSPLKIKEKEGHNFHVYEGGSISNSDIKVKLRYQPVYSVARKGQERKIESINLAWDLAIDQKDKSDYWSMRVDALTGKVLNQNNYTVYCNFDHKDNHTHGKACQNHEISPTTDIRPTVTEVLAQNNMTIEENMLMNGTYNVFPFPLESPSHGDQEIVTDVHSLEYSPFGWHDTDGVEGAEYTITRGNNVHSYLDENASNSSSGDEPDGGEDLNFDFSFDPLLEPADAKDLAVTQLFYSNNAVHDFYANYGFDEVSGNFQETNYTSFGIGGDYVHAEAQDGFGLNNANFGTPPDGLNPTMQMFLWNRSGNLLTVNEPESVAGTYVTGSAGFGSPITGTPLTGEVVIVSDGSGQPTLGCNELINDLTGKIALIDRNICEFGVKCLNAENAGAIGVIVCNDPERPFVNSMGAGAVGNQVTIPSVFVSYQDCQNFRQFAGSSLEVSLISNEDTQFLDGDLDNGIIAHEYGHGISNRLSGGPSNSGCLAYDEQMGEGWSDFFALVMTIREGDTPETSRGIGTYANNQSPVSGGIRRQPYSRDMAVNNQTYQSITGTGEAPHPLGEIWAVTLWDMYWNLVDEHGYDADITNVSAGNNIAIQLVLDGLKMQSCEAGFLGGRDAILAADRANNEGANQCLIWSTFARRGMGFGATGNVHNRNDHIESYRISPACNDEIYITKEMTAMINAGEEIEVTISVTNYKESMQTEVVISDEIPANASFVEGSSSVEAEVTGNMISFAIGDLPVDEPMTITYSLSTDADTKSIIQFYDDLEEGDNNWFFDANEGIDIWAVTDDLAHSGSRAWFVPDVNYPQDSPNSTDNDQFFYNHTPFEVMGTQPVLRFYHYYNTEWGFDGGHIEISTDEVNWDIVDEDKLFRNGYTSILVGGILSISNMPNFTGVSNNNFEFHPVMVDLSDYMGEEIFVRFRFTADVAVGTDIGWYVDDIEIMDMYNYNSEACVTSAEGANNCVSADSRGTIVESDFPITSTENIDAKDVSIAVQPNPAHDFLNVAIVNNKTEKVNLTLVSIDGKEVISQDVQTVSGQQTIPVNVSALAAGFYFVKVSTGTEVATEKVVIE